MDYLRYYPILLIPALGITGFLLGGQWVWLGLGTMPAVVLADFLSPQDYAPRRMRSGALADVVLYLGTLGTLAVYVAFAWRLNAGFEATTSPALAVVGATLSTLWLSLIPNVGAAHELLHRKNPAAVWLARLSFALIGAPTRDISHVKTHHLHFDTARDHDTGRRGETVYRFIGRCITGNTIDEFQTEKRRLAARGRSVWGWHSQIVWGAAMVLGVLGAMYAAAGTTGLIATLAIMVATRIVGEALNFLQHFGLLRVPGRPIESRHTWNHLSAVTRVIGMEITNHVEHHQDPDRPYYALTPHPHGPQMRNIIAWGVLAFFPTAWNRRIQPHLRRWDLEHASPEERALAREANRRAGWPDWIGEAERAAVPGVSANSRAAA
jgi:toluene methyl-monooxygenase